MREPRVLGLCLLATVLVSCSAEPRARSRTGLDSALPDDTASSPIDGLVDRSGPTTRPDAVLPDDSGSTDDTLADDQVRRDTAGLTVDSLGAVPPDPTTDAALTVDAEGVVPPGRSDDAGPTADVVNRVPPPPARDASQVADSADLLTPETSPDLARPADLGGRDRLTDLLKRDDLANLTDLAKTDDLADSANHPGQDDLADLANRDAVPDLASPDALPDVMPDSLVIFADTNSPDAPAPDLPIESPTDSRPTSGVCSSEPLRTTGTIHYVCDCQAGASGNCEPGSDTNGGTSPSAPMQSFSKAASTFARMPAGDTVALCRGGRWNANGGGFANLNCRKDNTCDLRDYVPPWGDGSEPFPAISTPAGSTGRTLMTFTHVAEHQEGFRVLNLDLHGESTDTGIFFWNETTDVDLCNLSLDGFKNSINMSGGDRPEFGTPANIVLRNSRITNNSESAYIAVCDHCAVEDSFFDNNGARNATTHSVYFASQQWTVDGAVVIHETTGMRLSRNQIHHSAVQCKGSPVVVHGRHKDVVIEDNVIDAVSSTDACWGPGVGCGGYPYGCWFRNTIIRRNTIKGLGNAGSENSNCTGCLIENNLIILDKSGNGLTVGGERPRPEGDPGYRRNDGQIDDPSNSAVIRNNTVYFTGTAASGKGIAVSSGTGHILENNAIYYAVARAGLSDNFCYGLPSNPTSAMTAVDYNICQIPSNAHWAIAPGAGTMTLAAWQTLSGLDQHSKQTDPMFSNAPTDFTPGEGSPLRDSGNPSNAPSSDLNGKSRDSQPDIGAFER